MKQDNIQVSKTIRVLAIAPYEGLNILLKKEAVKYPELSLTTITGDLESGLAAAQANFHSDYDVILSRGGTAQLLREKVSLPVVDIPISFFDILKAIQLSANAGLKRAAVGFESITRNVKLINDLLGLDLDIYTLGSTGDIKDVLPALKSNGYQIVICDAISSRTVQESGLNALLITSGTDSIDSAFNTVIETVHQMRDLRIENHFLRSVLREHSGETVVFNDQGDLYFSSINDQSNPEIISMLRELIPEVHEGTARHVWKSLKGYLYSIKSAVIEANDHFYTAFYFSSSHARNSQKYSGITYYTRMEAEQMYSDSLYHLTGSRTYTDKTLEAYSTAGKPILITGEYGTGKSAAAAYLYIHSSTRRKSMTEVDCGALNEKSADFLLHSIHSPFYADGNTIHIKNLERCSEKMLKELLDAINLLSVYRTNFIIFSGTHDSSPFQNEVNYIKNHFQCICMELPPMREMREQIPVIAGIYLNHLNVNALSDVIRIDRQALQLLQNYSWPGNFLQFQRIIAQAANASSDHLIHENAIRQLLSQEKDTAPAFVSNADGAVVSLDRPLADIEREIVQKVLEQNGGNQSMAAKRLGIGRTTLWRILKND